nr:MAG TPA: hypothetical protein [Inoviridae sp.]
MANGLQSDYPIRKIVGMLYQAMRNKLRILMVIRIINLRI